MPLTWDAENDKAGTSIYTLSPLARAVPPNEQACHHKIPGQICHILISTLSTIQHPNMAYRFRYIWGITAPPPTWHNHPITSTAYLPRYQYGISAPVRHIFPATKMAYLPPSGIGRLHSAVANRLSFPDRAPTIWPPYAATWLWDR